MRGQTSSFPSPSYRCWLCCLQVEGAHPDPVEAGTKLSDVRESDHIRRHLLDRLVPAARTSQFGLELYQRDCALMSGCAN